jgi:predicted Zn-dependent protease
MKKLLMLLVLLLGVLVGEVAWAGQASLVSDAEKQRLSQVWGRVVRQYSRFTRTAVPRLAIWNRPTEVNFFYQSQTHHVLVTTAAMRVFQGQDGEVAFFVGHELGHALVQHEPQQSERLLDFLRSIYLWPKAKGAPLSKREQETLPDMWGLCLMSAAGYNATDAAAGFGRMGMVKGTAYEWAARGQVVARWLDAHPSDQRRISLLSRAASAGLVQHCQGRR